MFNIGTGSNKQTNKQTIHSVVFFSDLNLKSLLDSVLLVCKKKCYRTCWGISFYLICNKRYTTLLNKINLVTVGWPYSLICWRPKQVHVALMFFFVVVAKIALTEMPHGIVKRKTTRISAWPFSKDCSGVMKMIWREN